ncbi:hypothetical protein [Candidatus Nitrosotenuis aquarius]|uniref:hypothetical protein n=1 Tax=Candidatus Nitrosotenuis aquarius TaxID=1846278 RepID=UPI000C1EA6BC|nr:hypothetical protein [Candidatus Nitrosotenuis aquarius]
MYKIDLILVISIIFLTPNIIHAQEQPNKPLTYNVGIQLENIGSIDRQNGSYELIFWVTLTSDEINFTKNPPPQEFDFTNGYVEEITGLTTEPHFHKFKVRGVFYNDMDFRNYPFENIDLAIHMEPYYPNTQDKLVFTVNSEYSGISNSKTTSVPGWELSNPQFTVSTGYYPWGEFSHFEAHYDVGTSEFLAFMKKLFPVAILMGFSFASFLLSPKNQAERLAMISAALLSAIFFHTGYLLTELPPLGYTTFADKIMIVAYVFFILCLIPTLLTRYYSEIKKQEFTVEQQILLDKKAVIRTPIVSFALFMVIYFLL